MSRKIVNAICSTFPGAELSDPWGGLEKRFDRQPCRAGILYECMRFLIGHCKVNAAKEFLSFGCVRAEHRLVSAYINRIINVAWCFGHGILLDPEVSILCPFQLVPQGGNFEITPRRGRS